MTRRTSAAITTACVSMAIGTAAYMMSGNHSSRAMKNRTKHLKRTTGRALHQVGSFIDNVSYMMK